MIYLFSNHAFGDQAYGEPFVAAAAQFAERSGVAVTRVVSVPAGGRHVGGRLPMSLRSFATRIFGTTRATLPEIVVGDINAREFVASLGPGDAGIIAGFDQIFKSPAIAAFSSFVNVHPSLLPYYRGPEPAYWCLANRETSTGFTIHRVTERIDDGPILYQQIVAVEPGDTPTSLSQRIANAALPAFVRWLEHVACHSPFDIVTADAAGCYRVHVGYRTFREKSGAVEL
jgi:methionyl-tRNA formyltransferase